jgi:hypothetical protein
MRKLFLHAIAVFNPWFAAMTCLMILLPGHGHAQSGAKTSAATLAQSTKCAKTLPQFGGHGKSYTAAAGSIYMTNDGWCWITIRFRANKEPYIPPVSVTSPPAHGTVQIDTVDQRVRIAYRPAAGFVGSDDFEVRATLPDNTFPIPIHTTVSP